MRPAKLQWLLFILAFFLALPARAQDKDPKKPNPKEFVYKGKTVKQWIEALEDKDEEVRQAAQAALDRIKKK